VSCSELQWYRCQDCGARTCTPAGIWITVDGRGVRWCLACGGVMEKENNQQEETDGTEQNQDR